MAVFQGIITKLLAVFQGIFLKFMAVFQDKKAVTAIYKPNKTYSKLRICFIPYFAKRKNLNEREYYSD
ncbi:MAG: hypothetical protein KOO64_11345, partial [Desulfobacterales bacterium]|nr:hypothetical protein [Desulfobacterales bacterium]